MLVKWILVAFAVTSVGLFVLGKVLAFLNPPRPGRPAPPLLRRVERTLRWTFLIPLAIAIALLVIALAGG
jgi:hypothetical protein